MYECINDVQNPPGDVADVKENPSLNFLSSILVHFVTKFGKSGQKSQKSRFSHMRYYLANISRNTRFGDF